MAGYISIKQVIDNCMEHPLLQDLTLERAINYAIKFIQIVGMPSIFIEKTAEIAIDNYRGVLPCDLNEIIQVRGFNGNQDDPKYQTFRYSTDSFHMSSRKTRSTDLTYKVQGNCIFTSIKNGVIEVAYKSIAVDQEGMPLIPEGGIFERALELFIKKQCFTILFDLGKLNNNVLQNVQQEYSWAVGQCQNDMIMPSVDQMQSFVNSWNTLLQKTNEHSNGFRDLGTKEILKTH